MNEEPEFLEAERIPHGPVPGGAGRPIPPDVIRRHRTALAIAAIADVLQWVFFPLFMSGALSPFADLLDVAIAVVMVRLVGWHWAFLPTFVMELIPFVDLVPTWTLAVLIATRGKR
jgi:hypothetical protein